MDIYQAKNIVQGSPNRVIVHKRNYNTRDIIELIKKALPLSVEQTKDLAEKFRRPTLEQTTRAIFDFLKTIRYQVDPEGTQVVPLPSKILADNRTDCKGLSIITHGILSNLGIEHAIRFARYKDSYNPNEFSHVYTIVPKADGSYITIDAVADQYNYEFGNMSGSPLELNFKKQMYTKYHPLNKVSGIGLRINNPFKWLEDQYNGSGLKKTLSSAQDSVKDKKDQFKNWIKEQAAAAQDTAKKLIQPLKTAAAAPMRAAYLTLLNLNLFGWASLFNYGRMSEDEQFDKKLDPLFALKSKAAYNAARDKWYEWGGDRTQFDNIVKLGATRKPKLDTRGNATISGIGAPMTIGTAIAIATPIILALGPLVQELKTILKRPPEIPKKDLEEGGDGGGTLTPTKEEDNTMLYVGGAAALALMFMMKK